MKKLFMLVAAGVVCTTAIAQKVSADNVPAPVLEAFKSKFSIAEKTTWELDYDNYEADFIVGKSSFAAIFDKDGKWLGTETYLKLSETPKVIREALSKKYGELSAYKVREVTKIEKEKNTVYELEVEKGETAYELVYDESGNLLEDDEKNVNKD